MIAPDDAVSAAGDGLGRQVRAGLTWSLATQVVVRATSLLSGIAVARILTTRDFRLYAVGLAAMAVLMTINDVGLIMAVVCWRGEPRDVAPTATMVIMGASVILYAACFLLAPAFAGVMGAPAATGPLRLMGLAILVDGVSAVPQALLVRELHQDRLAIANFVSVPVGAGASILLALAGAGAWSLAWGHLLGTAVVGGFMLRDAPFRARPRFDPTVARRLLSFGVPMAATSLAEQVLLNLDYVVVGHMLGPAALGLYLLAFNVANWLSGILNEAIRRVAIPGFSRAAADRGALASGFSRSFGVLITVAVPTSVLLSLFALPTVRLLYGERWVPAASALELLAFLGGARVMTNIAFDMLIGAGKPRTTLWLQSAWLAALAPALVVGTRLDGIRGAAAGHVVVAFGMVAPLFVMAVRRAGIPLRPLARAAAPPVIGGLVAAVTAIAVRRLVSGDLSLVVVGFTACLAAYAVVVVPFHRSARRRRTAGVTA